MLLTTDGFLDILINLVGYSSRLMTPAHGRFPTVHRMFALEQNVVQINLMPLKNNRQLNYQQKQKIDSE